MVLQALGKSDTPCDVCNEAHEFAVYARTDSDLSKGVERSQFKPELSNYIAELGIAFFCTEHLAELWND